MMKKQKITGITFRPLLLTTAVGLICHNYAFAQATPPSTPLVSFGEAIAKSPFAPRPFQLESQVSTTGNVGVKPNILFMIDDSGSMQVTIKEGGDYWSAMAPCDYDPVAGVKPQKWQDVCSYVFYDHATWRPISRGLNKFTQYTRMAAVIEGLNAVLDNYGDKANWNIYTLWGTEDRFKTGGRVDYGRYNKGWPDSWRTYKISDSTRPYMTADGVRPYVNSITPYLNTPTTDRYIRAVRMAKNGIQYRCQKSYIVMLSDGDANADGLPGYQYAQYENAGTYGFEAWEKKLYGTFRPYNSKEHDFYLYTPPGKSGEQGYRAYGAWPAYANEMAIGEQFGMGLFSHILQNADLKTSADGKDKEGGDWDSDENKSLGLDFRKQNIETYTVAFGDNLSARGDAYLRAGGACSAPQCYFKANTGPEIKKIFGDIVANAVKAREPVGNVKSRSTSIPSVTGSTLADLAASVLIDNSNWSSQLVFNKFDNTGRAFQKDANGKLVTVPATYNNRRVLVNNGNVIYYLNASEGVKEDFAIGNDTEFKNAFVPWLLRDSTKSDAQIELAAQVVKDNERSVKKYRKRTESAVDPARQMGDVIGAPIVALGEDGQHKQEYLITSANDGMVYIFGSTGQSSTPYNLELNYLPAGMQRESNDNTLTVGKAISAIAEEDYGKKESNPHLYLNNGGIAWVKTAKTAKMPQQYVMVGNMGQGGRGAYALSIGGDKRNGSGQAGLDAGDSAWKKEVPLWETEKGVGNGLGYTVSTPMLAQVATKWDSGKPRLTDGVHLYAFIANGYQPGSYDETGKIFTPNVNVSSYDKAPTLYVYDMLGQEFGTGAIQSSLGNGNTPGKLIRKISVSNTQAGALSTPSLIDVDFDGVVDFAYAGDQYGNLYRFNLRGAPSTWKATKIYAGKETQPITAAPALYRKSENKYVVVFGTGSDVFKHDQKSLDRQVIIGIHDDLENESPTVINYDDSSIVDQKIDEKGDRRYLEDKGFKIGEDKVWRIYLAEGSSQEKEVTTAEKAVTQPKILLNTVYLTTRIYDITEKDSKLPDGADPNQTCYVQESSIETKGKSWTMGINVLSGANPDLENGSYFTSEDNGIEKKESYAGIKENSISSAIKIFDATNVAPTEKQLDANGVLQPSGEEPELGNPSNKERNDCLSKSARPTAIQVVQENDANGVQGGESGKSLKSITLGGKRCSDPSLIRANMREISL
ncbi:MAG: PilC/PilY family type IV pilus protein [Cardiobacteriaceae bacterium]|nr:PilC/PilY family type IV pilus protein [Cardiobacteriaceae bacterium]